MIAATGRTKGAPRPHCTEHHLARTMRSLSTGTAGDYSSALSAVGSESLHSSKTSSVEGLRMAQDFSHSPVLLEEVTDLFDSVPSGVVVDATLGGAGHSTAILQSRPDLGIAGIDRDERAIAASTERLETFGLRVVVLPGRFSEVGTLVELARETRNWPEIPGVASPAPVVGILADLGVSSPQLDVAGRGFSFSTDGPLDMRMDTSRGQTASEFLDHVDLDELTMLLRENGEGRHARRIARAILAALPIRTTAELSDVVDRAVPRGDRRRGHVASRVFQGLRIAVNAELDELDALLGSSLELLAPGGRLVVISYHSGEDARVKHTMRAWADGDCSCPPGMPCVCGAVSLGSLIGRRAAVATEEEISRNPRSRSARLRTFEVGS